MMERTSAPPLGANPQPIFIVLHNAGRYAQLSSRFPLHSYFLSFLQLKQQQLSGSFPSSEQVCWSTALPSACPWFLCQGPGMPRGAKLGQLFHIHKNFLVFYIVYLREKNKATNSRKSHYTEAQTCNGKAKKKKDNFNLLLLFFFTLSTRNTVSHLFLQPVSQSVNIKGNVSNSQVGTQTANHLGHKHSIWKGSCIIHCKMSAFITLST